MPLFEWSDGCTITDNSIDDVILDEGMDSPSVEVGHSSNDGLPQAGNKLSIISNEQDQVIDKAEGDEDQAHVDKSFFSDTNDNFAQIDGIFSEAEAQLEAELDGIRNLHNRVDNDDNEQHAPIHLLSDDINVQNDETNNVVDAPNIDHNVAIDATHERQDPEPNNTDSADNTSRGGVRRPLERLIPDTKGKDYLSLRLNFLMQKKKEHRRT